MAVDKSLKIKGTLLRRRNVLSREERLLALEREGRWQTGDSVFGLAKVSTRTRKARGKKKKAKEPGPGLAAQETSEGAETAAGEIGEGSPES